MAGDPSPSLVVCVLGLSREKREHFSQQSGVGKSCLCYRFMHPGHDDYIDKHSSLLTLHEFENPVINSVHFLYWGSTTKRYPLRGSPKEQRIQFHVIEQTVFYQDVTSQPFKPLTKPDSLEYYIRRATAQIESKGKISYRSRDTITLRQDHGWQTYPSGISALPRGFLVVIDVSQIGDNFNRQIARAERIMEYLQKHKKKFVIVATKRDVFFPASMSKVQHLKRKYETQVFETSASVNLNISDAFRFIAFKILREKVRCVSDYVPTYEEAVRRLSDQKVSSKQIFRNYLKKTVVYSDERVYALENAEEYKDCIHVVGKFETDLLFAYHLVKVHSKKIGSFAVVKENPQLLLEFLEDFVDQRMDLALYSRRLRSYHYAITVEHHKQRKPLLLRWIRSYFGEHQVVSSGKEGSLGVKRREVASVSPATKDVNQRYQALHNPDSDDSEDGTSYVNYPLPRPPTEKPGTIGDYERGQLGSEKPDGMFQDCTSPTTRSKPPQVGPESTLLSADEPAEVQVSVREVVGGMDKEEGSSNREVFTSKLSAQLGSAVLSLTKETPSSSLKKHSHVSTSLKYSFSESVPLGSSDIKCAEHLEKLLSGKKELELEPTVAVASLNKSSHPATSFTKEAHLHSLKEHSHVDTGFIPSFAQLVKQDSGDGKNEKSITSPGISDIKRRAEHLKKLLSGDGEPTVTDASLNMSSPSFAKEEKSELEPTVVVASLNKSSHPAIFLTKEANLHSLKMHSHVDTSSPPGISDIKRRAEHLQKLLSGEGEPTVTDASLNMSSPPMTSFTKEAPLPSLEKKSHFDTSFKPSFVQLVKQTSDSVGEEASGRSDVKRCTERPEKLLCAEEEELEPSVAEVPLNKSSHPATSFTKEAHLHFLKEHSHVDTGFIPSFAQLVKQDSGDGKNEKSITSPGISDIKRRAEHFKKLRSGEGEPTVTDESLNMSSPPMTSFTNGVPLPSLKKKNHFDTSSLVQLVKQTSGSVGEEASGSSDAKRCAERPKKLLSGDVEELEPSVTEVPLNKSSPPQRIHGKQKQPPKTSQSGTRKPVRPASKLPDSVKLARNESLKDKPVKPASPSGLQGEQNNKSLFSLLSQLPPSRLQPSPITVPPPTCQTPQQSPVAPVSGSIPKEEIYVPRLPVIKRKLEEKKCLEEKQKVKRESFISESPKLPGTSLSPNNSRPPQPSRHQAPSYPAPPPPKESLPSSYPSHVLPSPKQMESSKPFPPPIPPPYQMVLPPSLPQIQMDSSLPPPPPKRMEVGQSLPNLSVSHEPFHFPSSYSLGEDSKPPTPQQTSDVFLTQTTLGDGVSSEQHSICPQLTRMKIEIKQRVEKTKWFYPDILPPTMKKQLMSESKKENMPTTSEVESRRDESLRPHSTMTTTMLKPSDSVTMKERPLPAEPFTVDSEDDESDHSYELIEFGPLLTEYVDISTFTIHHKCAPLSSVEVPVGFRGDRACKEEKQMVTPSSSDIKRQAEQPKKLLREEEEELEPSAAVTILKNSSTVATQYNKQRQSFQPGTRKPVKPAPYKPPVSNKSAKDDSLEKTPLKLIPPSRFQGEEVHKAQQLQLSPSRLQLSPITSPPPTYQVPKQIQMTRANGNISGTEMCISNPKRTMEENCLHEQPQETNQPPTVPTKKNRSGYPFDDPTVYENLPVPDKPIEYVPAVDDNYENWETIGSTDSQFSAGGSPWPISVQPPPVPAMRKSHRFSFVNLPAPDKTLDYLPMSRTVDDMYVNWETIGYNPAQLHAGQSPQPSQHPSVPTNSKPHTFSSDDLTDYVNLPVPDKVLVLPPGGLERQPQLMLESVQQSSPRPIPSSRMPQSTDEKTHSPVSPNKPTPLPRMRSQKTSVSLVGDGVVTVQEVRSVGITTGGPTHCTSSWQRTNKVLHEKQQSLKQ